MPLSKIVAKSITDDTITTDQIADNPCMVVEIC